MWVASCGKWDAWRCIRFREKVVHYLPESIDGRAQFVHRTVSESELTSAAQSETSISMVVGGNAAIRIRVLNALLQRKLEGYEIICFKELNNSLDCLPSFIEVDFIRECGIVFVGGLGGRQILLKGFQSQTIDEA